MARNFAGGTDRIAYYSTLLDSISGSAVSVAARFKTSSATANAQVLAHWNSGSRRGWGLILNNPAGKILLNAYDNAEAFGIRSTTSVNDGNWHSIVCTMSKSSGQPNIMYIDGVQESTANSGIGWSNLSTNPFTCGDSYDGFWGSYNGELADIGYWDGILTPGEAAACGKGFSPPRVRQAGLKLYVPMVRDNLCRAGNGVSAISGTTVTDHPRVIGSMV